MQIRFPNMYYPQALKNAFSLLDNRHLPQYLLIGLGYCLLVSKCLCVPGYAVHAKLKICDTPQTTIYLLVITLTSIFAV